MRSVSNGAKFPTLLGMLLALSWSSHTPGQESTSALGSEQVEFFEKKIRPVLVERC
jgi:hypothetical protein